MPDSAPFQVTNEVFKDLIEGNRFSTSAVYDGLPANDISLLVRAKSADSGYVLFSPIKVSSQDTVRANFNFNPTVTDTGTELDVTNRRVDGPVGHSTAFRDVTYSGGNPTGSVLILAGTNKVGTSIDEKALIVPDGMDVIFTISSVQGTTNTTMGVEVIWSEVPDTIIPDLTLE